MYNDAQTFGFKSANANAANNSYLAITWLEATFPELADEAENGGNLFAVKARPFVLLDYIAGISLVHPVGFLRLP